MRGVGRWKDEAIDNVADEAALDRIASEVRDFCRQCPAGTDSSNRLVASREIDV